MSGTDGESITFELRLRPQAVEGFLASAPALIEGTAQFPGFRSIRIVQHRDEPGRLLFIERWEHEQAYRDYLAWRAGQGQMEGLQQAALGMEINVWPKLILEKSAKDAIGAEEGVSITFELQLRPEAVGPFTQATGAFDAAASFPGFLGIRMVQHKEDPARILFLERWASEAAYKAYVDWQEGRGGMEQIRQISTSAEMNVWPKLVVSA